MNLLREYLIEPFSYGFMQRGVLSAILLSLSGGILGPVLILRRLALMGDALAHSLLPGVALAYLLFGPNLAALFLGSLFAGLLTGAGSALLSRLTRIKEDAAFGALFVIFFAAGIAIVSTLRTKIDLMHFLFGNILAVSPTDLGVSGAACAITLGVFIVLRRSILLETFDPIFHRATGGRGGLTHVGLLCLTVINLVAALQVRPVKAADHHLGRPRRRRFDPRHSHQLSRQPRQRRQHRAHPRGGVSRLCRDQSQIRRDRPAQGRPRRGSGRGAPRGLAVSLSFKVRITAHDQLHRRQRLPAFAASRHLPRPRGRGWFW
jgi:ABC-type Mn2+/Zn2+ transport system permease subunit